MAARIRELRARGRSLLSIAQALGVGHGTVARELERLGLRVAA